MARNPIEVNRDTPTVTPSITPQPIATIPPRTQKPTPIIPQPTSITTPLSKTKIATRKWLRAAGSLEGGNSY